DQGKSYLVPPRSGKLLAPSLPELIDWRVCTSGKEQPLSRTSTTGVHATSGLSLVSTGANQMRIYANMDALPGAYLVQSINLADSSQQALDLISSKEFEPLREAVLERSEHPDSSLAGSSAAGGKSAVPGMLMIHRQSPELVQIKASTTSPALLVLTD